jgi:hypothetical protein
MRQRCAAFTQAGERCRNPTVEAEQYCSRHLEAFTATGSFIKAHKDHVVGFLLGVLSETIVDDGYEKLKGALIPKGNKSSDHATICQVLKLVTDALPVFVSDDHHFKVEFLAASRSAPYSLFECHRLKKPHSAILKTPEGGSKAAGVIGVFYNDDSGRRFVGEIEGTSVWIDYDSDPIALMTKIEEAGESELMHRYEMHGAPGQEWLALTKQFYFISGSSLLGQGSLGAMWWNNPVA